MEGRMSKYRQVSPERSKVWTEKSPKYHYNHNYNHQQQQNGKVPVVYYLCRNRQLEHPHFMEVPLSSPDGLYLRGGFSPSGTVILQNQKALPGPPSSRSQEESSSSSSLNGGATKSSQEDELSPTINHHCSLVVSPESSGGKNSSWNGSLTLAEYKVYKSDGLADASTQTDENATKIVETRETCTRGVSTDEPKNSGTHQNEVPQTNFVSTPPSTSSASSSSGRTDTLESLIRADVKKINSFRILEEEGFRNPSSNTKLKASNMIMQLISCGSISVKDYSFGLIPSYKPSFSHSKFPSPLFSTSSMFSELDRMADNPRLMSMRVEDKEYFSGSLIETSMLKEGVPVLKRSSSYNAERSTQQFDSTEDKEEGNSKGSKCIPRSIKASLSKQPRCESMRSPLSDGPRISSDRVESSRTITHSSSNPGSKRITELRKRPESSKNSDENMIKIEES
ncbi:hypothetical protein BUALT_Bualt02G0037100 [Buddleja alternifolia]|uniref:SOSEKI DIX-like domain-containing protein n=1 Tax=Buddleja alternifolia TaxID=168488 RepID=A0AAV6Y5P4_9LAMI|nr:hypothetical protein BUALT_Bualt02G0036800 [Buddleja alternifolia]KAG8387590.1 hypothetical protein BUALT_Bualt02G0037100 [Buddleja alternifolia]